MACVELKVCVHACVSELSHRQSPLGLHIRPLCRVDIRNVFKVELPPNQSKRSLRAWHFISNPKQLASYSIKRNSDGRLVSVQTSLGRIVDAVKSRAYAYGTAVFGL